MWWDGKTWRNASEVNSDSEDRLQKEVSEILDKIPSVVFDAVEKPAHYNQGGVEAIDYIRQQLGEEGFRAYCLGNVYKYLHRHNYKGKPQEDLSKALWYLNKAKETF